MNSAASMPALVLRHGLLLSMCPGTPPIPDGTMVVEDGTISFVGGSADAPPSPPGAETVDCSEHIVMPGLINAHTHLPMSLFRGMADDLPLQEWLEKHMFPAEATFIDPVSAEVGTRLSLAEMILSGTTCCADGYFCEAAVLRTAAEMGMRGIFAHGCIDYPAPGVPDPARIFETIEDFLDTSRHGDLQRPAVFAHSPYTCSPETLRKAKQLAEERDTKLFIHIAETAWEVQWCAENCGGLTPVAYLDSLGILGADTVLVHAVHVTEADADLIALRNSKIVLNPESNLKLASGIAPLSLYASREIPVGLGTDSAASNNDLDLLGEIKTAALLWQGSMDSPQLAPSYFLAMATQAGADVLGLERKIGTLEAGKRADIITVRTGRSGDAPPQDPWTYMTHRAEPEDIDRVWIDGVLRAVDGELLDADTQRIMADAHELAAGIDRFARNKVGCRVEKQAVKLSADD